MAHDYPGNVRELKSILQAAVNLSRGGGSRSTACRRPCAGTA
jgi:transcriptional regulator with PAS, ATPase and Fis domain